MRKPSFFVLIAIICSCIFSCSKSETYADKLKKERKLIKGLRNDSSFVFIDNYPINGVFEPNQFFFDENTGVYFNVVDSGNGNRAKTDPSTEVYIRFNNTFFLGEDDIRHSNQTVTGIFEWVNFEYGKSETYTSYTSTFSANYSFKSVGLTGPLKYVGEGAIVKIIVPFNSGSAEQRSRYLPLYFGHIQYNFRPEQEQ